MWYKILITPIVFEHQYFLIHIRAGETSPSAWDPNSRRPSLCRCGIERKHSSPSTVCILWSPRTPETSLHTSAPRSERQATHVSAVDAASRGRVPCFSSPSRFAGLRRSGRAPPWRSGPWHCISGACCPSRAFQPENADWLVTTGQHDEGCWERYVTCS